MEIIHFILGKANPDRMNGVNKVVHHLASAQAAAGLNVQVWGITDTPNAPVADRDFETRLFPKNKLRFVLSQSVCDALEQLVGNVVFHFHGGFIPEFSAMKRLLSKHQFPYIITPHGSYNTLAMAKSKWMKRLYFSVCERGVLADAKAIHMIGASEIDGLEAMGTFGEPVLIPNGYAPEVLPEKTVSKRRNANELVFGYCGRLDMHTKGLDIMLEGFAAFLKRNQVSASLWIIGGGADSKALEAKVGALNLGASVSFWGPRYGSDKISLLKDLDAFLHPSRNEGMPTAVLEAAGLGVPSIVSQESNISGKVDEYRAGVGMAENTAKDFAQALETIAREKKAGSLENMKANATRMVETAFDWNSICQELVQVYKA